MKYLYHRPDDGGILLIAHHLEPTNPNPYIEIDDSIAADFFSAKLHMYDFAVTAEGTLKSLYVETENPMFISEKVFAVPRTVDQNADLIIQQNVKNKQLIVTVSQTGLELAQMNRFQNQGHCVLVACVPSDPHLYQWHWSIQITDLYDSPVIYHYTGSDQIQFYTKKIFRSYAHEQLN